MTVSLLVPWLTLVDPGVSADSLDAFSEALFAFRGSTYGWTSCLENCCWDSAWNDRYFYVTCNDKFNIDRWTWQSHRIMREKVKTGNKIFGRSPNDFTKKSTNQNQNEDFHNRTRVVIVPSGDPATFSFRFQTNITDRVARISHTFAWWMAVLRRNERLCIWILFAT